MIKCSSCGCENSDYSIYCKQCSAVLFSSEMKPDENVSVPVEPSQKAAMQPKPEVAAPSQPEPVKASSGDKTEELRAEGFKYIPFEKDQQGSYTMDPSKANKPRSAEVEEDMANDRRYLVIYSIIGVVAFAIIMLVVTLIGLI